ncbi:MAG: hypothetical protein LBV43_12070 [Prevotella sp.]|jgi:hypothetical protein|nr:hypothetical protein [Prevotella sp.]
MLDKFDKNKNPFKVPENYFENLNAEIMSKLPKEEIQEVKIVPLWKKIVPWTAIAAAFCGILFMTGILRQQDTSSDPLTAIDQTESAMTASSLEDDYYLFLEDEVSNAKYMEMLYSDNSN